MSKSLVIVLLLAFVAMSLAGDVTFHPGYAGYGHGVSYRYDHRYYPFHFGFSPYGFRYGGYKAGYYGYGLGDYYSDYYDYPYINYWTFLRFRSKASEVQHSKMSKSLVIVLLLAFVAMSLAGDVTFHPGYAGYGHGVSYRYDHRYYPFHFGFSPYGFRYGGYKAGYYGYGLGDYYSDYYDYPYTHYW
ncbi:shematrin-like protein 1 [Centruroides vittatus]|uniref:shematrin-like protein 1 n=1 Tax=Centruroides vittatus TaxID=120091 RepID=UPI00350F23B8